MKILIADDHWVVRAGLRHVLAELDKAEILEVSSFPEAVTALGENQDINLVILDLLMPGNSPFAGLQEVRQQLTTVPVIVFSILESRDDVLRAIDLGAMGYVAKSTSGKDLIEIIRRVMSGEIWVPKDLLTQPPSSGAMQEPLAYEPEGRHAHSIEDLTGRQREVFELLSQGKSNRQIAVDLGVSEHTVRVHMTAILRSLGVENRTQAAVLAAGYQVARGGGGHHRRG